MIRPYWATEEALAKPARALRLIGATLMVSVVLGLIYILAGLFIDFTDMRLVAVYALAGSVRDLIVTGPIIFGLFTLVRSPVSSRTRVPAIVAMFGAAAAVGLAAFSNIETASSGAIGNPTALALAGAAGGAGLAMFVALVLALRGFASELGVPELVRLARGVFIAAGVVGAVIAVGVVVAMSVGGAAWIAVGIAALIGGGVVLNRLLALVQLLAGACETVDSVAETFA